MSVIAFLTDLADTADEAGLSEQETYILLPRFLKDDALRLYKTSVIAAQGNSNAVSN